MSNYATYRPSKRPKVSQVQEWNTCFIGEIENDWRGAYGGTCIVQNGYPFQDFYKVRYKMGLDKKWSQKLFYGESAHGQVKMFVYDLGFRTILGAMF